MEGREEGVRSIKRRGGRRGEEYKKKGREEG